ncbi:hypothetical protein QOZ80_4AG0302830 [Eleusine coracana subsp. coracana]|nr:hypothetical protein QOZ80_4AG0302830 [Eleusine coracana subsp. coracana]
MTTGGEEEEKKKTACVTGGNGYIASALIKVLLEKGYVVKTTVRNPDDIAKNSHFKDLQALGPLEVFRADLDEEGSFDDAVAGCDYAFLVAAPVNLTISLVSLCSILTIGSSPVPKVYTSVLVALSLLFDDKVAFEMLKGIEKAYGGVHVVDLDHLCRAQLLMAETETASGRYVCCGFNTTVVEMTRFLARKYRHYNVIRRPLEKPRVCLSSAKLVREGLRRPYQHYTANNKAFW